MSVSYLLVKRNPTSKLVEFKEIFMEITEDKLTILAVANELLRLDLEVNELKKQLKVKERGKGMLITLSGCELEDAIKDYFQKQFNKQVEVTVSDSEAVQASIVIGSLENEIEQVSTEKPKRTRTKKEENLDKTAEDVSNEPEEKTKYSSLPKLNKEDQTIYTQILTLLNNNPLNKHREELEKLSLNVSDDLKTVLDASEHFNDWLTYCKEQNTKEESKENIVEVKEEPISEPVVTKKLFGSPDPSVQKTGTIFTTTSTRTVF